MAQKAAKNTFGGKLSADSFVQRGNKVDVYKEAARLAVEYVEGDKPNPSLAQAKKINAD